MMNKKDIGFKEYSKKVTLICVTAIFASPLTDFMFVFNNTKITDTHISNNSKEN